ncbi:MAG: hypothetical protein QOD57_2462 [Actinomycetota bacterium]|nr:hypothetical protein [Actinomycetota bacterium]
MRHSATRRRRPSATRRRRHGRRPTGRAPTTRSIGGERGSSPGHGHTRLNPTPSGSERTRHAATVAFIDRADADGHRIAGAGRPVCSTGAMLTAFGVTVLTFMMTMYALENRGRGHVAAFLSAARCRAATGSSPARGRSASSRPSGVRWPCAAIDSRARTTGAVATRDDERPLTAIGGSYRRSPRRCCRRCPAPRRARVAIVFPGPALAPRVTRAELAYQTPWAVAQSCCVPSAATSPECGAGLAAQDVPDVQPGADKEEQSEVAGDIPGDGRARPIGAGLWTDEDAAHGDEPGAGDSSRQPGQHSGPLQLTGGHPSGSGRPAVHGQAGDRGSPCGDHAVHCGVLH